MTSIKNGDAQAVLKRYKTASFDGAFCDPPYGIFFMSAKWDKGVPGVEVWAEVLRVLKPGAWLMAFGGTRTYHRLTCAIEDAGFEIRDCLSWLYGSGFPKGKGCLKPAWEPIILARKRAKAPLLNIDECRIAGQPWKAHDATGLAKTKYFTDGEAAVIHKEPHKHGRWPANVILDEHAAVLLDEQSGQLKSGARKATAGRRNDVVRLGLKNGVGCAADSGGASRFFYVAKASRRERGESNAHPTVKPIKLTEHLAKLILPAGESKRLLIPFSGSGSEMLGAKRAGWRDIVGIEISAEYKAIAEKRLAA